MPMRADLRSLAKCCLRVHRLETRNSPASDYDSVLPSGNFLRLECFVHGEIERID